MSHGTGRGREEYPDAEARALGTEETDGTSPEADGEPSKSRRKRDADAVRELGRRLAELAPRERATIPLDDDVRAAIDELNAIRKHGARKRQLGFLAKRLRRIDLTPIELALERLAHAARSDSERHRRVERWRDRLLGSAPAEALTSYLDTHPGADRQRLRQLQKRALDERAADRPPAASRELFRLLRDAEPSRPDPSDAS